MNFNQIKFGKSVTYLDGIANYLKGAMVWGFKSKFKWSQTSTDIWGFATPNSIDPEAQAVYDRIIADGGVSNLIRLNYFVVGLKTIYGTLANVPVCYDAHWIGYKLGSGTGATSGQAAAKLYTISVIQTVSDSDAQAFIYRVYNAGGELTNTEANAVNQLTIDMKSAGIWTAMKAVYPMVGASAAACAQNLKSSSFTGTFNGGWTYASTGVKPNGSNAFCDTNLPNNTMSQNSMTMCTYLRTNNTITTGDLGVWNGGFGSIIYSRNGLGNYGVINNSTSANFVQVAVANSLGFFLNKRSSSTQVLLQQNSTQTTAASNSQNLLTSNFIIARTGNYAGEYSDRETAFVGIGDGLTDTQASDFYTAVQAFQTTLSRQV